MILISFFPLVFLHYLSKPSDKFYIKQEYKIDLPDVLLAAKLYFGTRGLFLHEKVRA